MKNKIAIGILIIGICSITLSIFILTQSEPPKCELSTEVLDYPRVESEKLSEPHDAGGYSFEDLVIYKDGEGYVIFANVINQTKEDSEYKEYKIELYNNKNELITSLIGTLQSAKKGQIVATEIKTRQDLFSTYDYKIIF